MGISTQCLGIRCIFVILVVTYVTQNALKVPYNTYQTPHKTEKGHSLLPASEERFVIFKSSNELNTSVEEMDLSLLPVDFWLFKN